MPAAQSENLLDASEVAQAEPQTILEALERAERVHGQYLIIWDSAREAATRSGSTRVEDVYDALEAVAHLSRAYFASPDRSVGQLKDYFKGFNFGLKESETTMGMHGHHRQFRHQGTSREMQRHLTIGKNNVVECIQIYFDADEQTGRFAIGYCGEHLPNASSTY